MRPVTRLFRRRPKVDPLGDGVWRRAHDRFVRAVDRVHMALDGVPEGPVHDDLAQVAGRFAVLVDDVFGVCAAAQAAAPSAGSEVPGGEDGRFLDVHRALSRAATLVAQASEAMTMARVELGGDRPDAVAAGRFAEPARRSAEQVGDLVGQARRLVAG